MEDLIVFLRARLDEDSADVAPFLRDPHLGKSDDELHQRNAHPAYEYATTQGQRKAWSWVDDPPEGEGWELNATSVDPDAFERFDYTEERYWRRLRPDGTGNQKWTPSQDNRRRAADTDAKRRIIDQIVPMLEALDQAELKRVREYHGYASRLLRLLALPYADHPDYRDDWRP